MLFISQIPHLNKDVDNRTQFPRWLLLEGKKKTVWGGWDELGDWGWRIYTADTMYKIDS